MDKICTIKGYDLYQGRDQDDTPFYNAVKTGEPPPNCGYYSFTQLLKRKNVERRLTERKQHRERKTL